MSVTSRRRPPVPLPSLPLAPLLMLAPLLLALALVSPPAEAVGAAQFAVRALEAGAQIPLVRTGLNQLQCAGSCARRRDCVAWNLTDTGCYMWYAAGIGGQVVPLTDVFTFVLPAGYTMGPNRAAYWMSPTSVAWTAAAHKADCTATDSRARPALPYSTDSMTYLKTLGAKDMYLRVGLSCTSVSTYVYTSGGTAGMSAAWFASGVIDDCLAAGSNCVSIRSTGLHQHTCSHVHRYACEIRNVAP